MNILLAGNPGIGKTTIIKKVISDIENAGGFYTEEIRNKYRKGFRIVTLAGEKGILAHVDIGGRYTVGKYGVNLKDLDGIAVKSVEESLDKDLIVIDEIGKMELYSRNFKEVVDRALNTEKVLGTIMSKNNYFIKKIKNRDDTKIVIVDKHNRNSLVEKIKKLIT
ncbi:MAG: NTPase [Euryarchaeota archaeon]|nr:NTPase [Euryarchaeota archaeon]